MKKIVTLVVCFFISTGIVNAETKTVISRNINNMYSRRFINGRLSTIQAAILFINDGVAYSINPNSRLTSTTYTVSSDFELVGIDEDKLHYLELVSYFSYPHHCGLNECYLAAQEIIWEYLTNDDYYWINAYGAYINIEYFKEKILNNIENYQKTPNISLYVETYKGEDIILEDNNNVLKYYESNSSLGTISDNKLTLAATNPGIHTITLKRKPLSNSNYSSHVYFSDGSQTLVTFGYTNNSKYNDTLEMTYKVKTKSQIKVIVKDLLTSETIKDNQTKIKIYDVNNKCYIKENDSEIITIDETGIYQSSTSFESGEYIIEELESPTGYQKINSPVTFNIDEYNESNIEVTVYNEKLEIDNVEEDIITKDEDISVEIPSDVENQEKEEEVEEPQLPSEEDNPEISDNQTKEDEIVNSEIPDKEESETPKEEQDKIEDSDNSEEATQPEIDKEENKDNSDEIKDSTEKIEPDNSEEQEKQEDNTNKENDSNDLEDEKNFEDNNSHDENNEEENENNSTNSDNKDKISEETNKNESNNIVSDKEEMKFTIDSVETVVKNPNTYRNENSKINMTLLLFLLMYLYISKRLNLHS